MSVLTLSDVKQHLGFSPSDIDDDAELQTFIESAESAIAEKCGHLGTMSTTARVEGRSRSLVLPTAPVVSLVSVTPVGGTALDLSLLNLLATAGVVEYLDGSAFTDRLYDVAFQAGRTTSPPDLLLATKELVRHLWLTQRGAAPGSPGALPDNTIDPTVGRTFTFPWRVEQLIAPYLLVDL